MASGRASARQLRGSRRLAGFPRCLGSVRRPAWWSGSESSWGTSLNSEAGNLPGLVGESGCFVRKDVLRFGASVLEGCVAGHVGHQMLAGGLELVADQAEVEQEDPEVVLGALGIEIPLAAGGCPT